MQDLSRPAGALGMLCGGLVFFTGVVLLCMWLWPDNEKVFVLFSGILGTFNGALMTYLQQRRAEKKKGEDEED